MALIVITKGTNQDIILPLIQIKNIVFLKLIPTLFPLKKWLSNLAAIADITIDNGAKEALKNNKSLLPVGVLKYQGKFNEEI